MSTRKITNPSNVKFEPVDNYGSVIPRMSWHKITYNAARETQTLAGKLHLIYFATFPS